MEKWRKEELTDKIINACITVHKELDKEIGLLVNFADFTIDVRRVELRNANIPGKRS